MFAALLTNHATFYPVSRLTERSSRWGNVYSFILHSLHVHASACMVAAANGFRQHSSTDIHSSMDIVLVLVLKHVSQAHKLKYRFVGVTEGTTGS